MGREFRQPGTVALVGAGPGDPELLTIRAWRRLQQADVVLHDQLVSEQILAMCPAHAERIDVGKTPGGRSMSQDEINEHIVQHAQRGGRVVRLKGGDPFVFGRGLEEALYAAEHGIEAEVVPGITSSVAGPAAAMVPVTHRGVATCFSVVTASGANDDDTPLESRWAALARAGGTLVFLMGVRKAERIVSVLLEAGQSPDRPACVIESAWTAEQRVLRTTLCELAQAIRQHNIRNPAVIVVGEVVDVGAALAATGRIGADVADAESAIHEHTKSAGSIEGGP